MNYPIIEIYTENTADITAYLLCFLAKGISTGTYQDGGYIVTPDLVAGNPKSVHFPDLGYSKEFWRTINFCPNLHFSSDFPASAITEVKMLLTKRPLLSNEIVINKIKSDWQKIEREFFSDIENFLDLNDALARVSKIKVLITPFGTRGSFHPPRTGNNFNLITTSRIDCPAGNIASGILQNLFIIKTRIGGEIGTDDYLKRMSTINFLFTNTVFRKYYPDFCDLTKADYSIDRELFKKSNKYLAKLGFPAREILSFNEKGELLLNGSYTNGTFSEQEYKLLKSLKELKLLTFDEVANILWGDAADDKYSLEAMAKVVESIRRKLRDNGVQKNLINTIRGKGYYLNY